MTIVLRHNTALDLNLVEYQGSVTLAELQALAASQSGGMSKLTNDTLTVVQPGADFKTIAFAELDSLFDHYRALFAPIKLQIYRRSAWICRSAAALPHVNHWLGGRDMRLAMLSDVRLFDNYAEAGDWLLLNDAELALAERGEGFVELMRFGEGAALAR